MDIQKYAPVTIRVGLAFVFIWFGLNQLLDQSMWTSLIPDGLIKNTGVSAETFVILNGSFELFTAGLLAFGIRVRLVGLLLSLHLLFIILSLELSAIAIRDIGLLFGLTSLTLYGPDQYSLDKTTGLWK